MARGMLEQCPADIFPRDKLRWDAGGGTPGWCDSLVLKSYEGPRDYKGLGFGYQLPGGIDLLKRLKKDSE